MIFTEEFMEPLFIELRKCKGLDQNEDHHPEKDLLEHSLQVFNVACRETFDVDLILASLLHDVGKVVQSHGHEDYSVDMLEPYLSPKSIWLIKHHMRIWTFISGEMRKLSKVRELSEHPWFPELVCLGRFDKIGRNPNKKTIYNESNIIYKLNKVVGLRFQNNQNKKILGEKNEKEDIICDE